MGTQDLPSENVGVSMQGIQFGDSLGKIAQGILEIQHQHVTKLPRLLSFKVNYNRTMLIKPKMNRKRRIVFEQLVSVCFY